MAQSTEIRVEDRPVVDRLLTIPNVLSIIRLAGVPLFLWLLLGPQADGWALVVLVASGVTDWLDGKLARWLNQTSQLGAMLDPAADRLYTLATLVAFVIRDIDPAGGSRLLLVGRDVVVWSASGPAAAGRLRPARGDLRRQGSDLQPDVRVPAAAARPGRLDGGRGRPAVRLRVHHLGQRALPVVRPALRHQAVTALQRARPALRLASWTHWRQIGRARGDAAGDPGGAQVHRGARVGRRADGETPCGSASPTTPRSSSATWSSSSCRRWAQPVAPATPVGEVESTKSVSEIYAPLAGEVIAVNDGARRAAGADQHRPVRRGLDLRAHRSTTRTRVDGLLDACGLPGARREGMTSDRSAIVSSGGASHPGADRAR